MKFRKFYIKILLIGLSVTFPFFLGEGAKNMLLVAIMSVSPIMLLIWKKNYDKVDYYLLAFIFLALGVCVLHVETFRYLSYLYSFCFITSFLFLRNVMERDEINLDSMILFLRYLIYVYGVVLLIQQTCVVLGRDPILANAYNVESKWKLSSLTPEPSHLARFVFFIQYVYLVLREKQLSCLYTFQDARNEKLVWFIYFWVMLTCQSTTAFLFTFLMFGRYVKIKTIIPIAILGFVIGFTMLNVFEGNKAFDRVINFIPALLSGNAEVIDEVDHSGAHRIIPIFVFIDWLDISSVNFWLGNGMDYGVERCREFMFMTSGDIVYADNKVNLGGLFTTFLDYGVIVMSFFIAALYSFFRKVPDKYLVLCWIFINLFSGINTQIFWFSLFLVMTTTYVTNDGRTVN